MTRLADHIEIDRAAGTTARLRFALTGSAALDVVAARRFGRDNAARIRRRVSPERSGACHAPERAA